MRYAMVDADGEVLSVVHATDPQNIALNTPAGATAIPCPDDCRPGAYRYDGEAFVAHPATAADQWAEVRSRRDTLLAASDYFMLPDSPLTDEQRAAWVAYRLALREITEGSDPAAVQWPIPPSQA